MKKSFETTAVAAGGLGKDRCFRSFYRQALPVGDATNLVAIEPSLALNQGSKIHKE
jgi:hypothetical protein